MTLLILFALLGIVGLLLILLATFHRRASQQTQFRLRTVDVLAFRNLMDPREEAYLRESLPPAQFNSLQRERMRAAAEYILATIYNSGILIQLAQRAALSRDPAVVSSAKQLLQMALRLRALGAMALGKVYVRILFPGAPLSVERLVEGYHRMNILAGQLVHFQRLPEPADLFSSLARSLFLPEKRN
jgi:hypothetical protein